MLISEQVQVGYREEFRATLYLQSRWAIDAHPFLGIAQTLLQTVHSNSPCIGYVTSRHQRAEVVTTEWKWEMIVHAHTNVALKVALEELAVVMTRSRVGPMWKTICRK
jgi:hypothetical protein